jgi:hypothetical protein
MRFNHIDRLQTDCVEDENIAGRRRNIGRLGRRMCGSSGVGVFARLRKGIGYEAVF